MDEAASQETNTAATVCSVDPGPLATDEISGPFQVRTGPRMYSRIDATAYSRSCLHHRFTQWFAGFRTGLRS